MNVEFLQPAQAELTEPIDYYNEQKEGLGFEFAEEVKEAIERVIQYPEAWSLKLKKIGELYSVRVGIHYRSLGIEKDKKIYWFWIGNHREYEKIMKG